MKRKSRISKFYEFFNQWDCFEENEHKKKWTTKTRSNRMNSEILPEKVE